MRGQRDQPRVITTAGLSSQFGFRARSLSDNLSTIVPSTEPTPSVCYARRGREIDLAAEEANRRCGSHQAASFFLILAVLVIAYAAIFYKSLPAWVIIVPAAGLAVTIPRSQRLRREVLKFLSVRDYYDKGMARLRREWDALDEGEDFVDRDHIYATDLDLFGRGSLFQLLCSARTHAGREALASWMTEAAGRDEVLARHAAVSELRERHDVRERVAAAGRSSVFTVRPRTIRSWVGEMSSQPRLSAWTHAAALAIVAVMAAIPFLYWFGHIGLHDVWFSAMVWLAVEGAFAYPFAKRVQLIAESTEPPSVELQILADLLEIIERERVTSPLLVAVAGRVRRAGAPASRQVRRLHRLARILLWRNTFVPLSLLLWGTQFATAIDHWHRRLGSDLLQWVAAVAEFEALVSVSAYAFEHPTDVFPEFVDKSPLFEAEGLGHPLLDEDVCVRNNMRLDDESRFLIVSGSNMSGKSTFLRAVGANAILARMGAPVRCARLRLSELEVGGAIRVQDSLADGQSHFFAEMQRLRRIIDLAGQRPMLFVVDEIMSGTNSKDRRIAAEWVMSALMRRGAVGLITTHDLTLTEIASNGLAGSNVYFEDSGEGGNLKFDYKLHAGLLTHSNALNIVRMLGIDTET